MQPTVPAVCHALPCSSRASGRGTAPKCRRVRSAVRSVRRGIQEGESRVGGQNTGFREEVGQEKDRLQLSFHMLLILCFFPFALPYPGRLAQLGPPNAKLLSKPCHLHLPKRPLTPLLLPLQDPDLGRMSHSLLLHPCSKPNLPEWTSYQLFYMSKTRRQGPRQRRQCA